MGSWTLINSTEPVTLKLLGGLKSQGKLILYEPPDIGSPLAFSVNETLSFHNKYQNHSYVWSLAI